MTFLLIALAAPAAGEAPLSVSSIKARLFFNYSGTLSEPTSSKTILWNAVIGEGNISEPSNSTFVDVAVHGEPGSFDPKARVNLLVSDLSTGKVIQTQASEIGVLNASGNYHAGFWIQKTGCVPLRIRAAIAGSKSQRTITVPFSCGE